MSGFLKLILCISYVCVFVSVSMPEAINKEWHDMDFIKFVKQVLKLLYGNCSCYREWAWPWHQYAS